MRNQELVSIDWSVTDNVEYPQDYFERWRILLWDTAFLPILYGDTPFLKSTKFKDFPGTTIAMKRVLYR